MKINKIISLITFALFVLSVYFSIITDFPYVLYFFIVVPIVFVGGAILYSALGIEERKWEKENEQRELVKNRRQDIWDSSSHDQKDKISKVTNTKLRAKRDKDANEYKELMITARNVEKLAEEKRLRIIRINRENEENEKQERFIQVEEAKQKEAVEKAVAEKRLMQQQEQIEKRDALQKNEIKRKILENERRRQLESEAIQELIDAGLIDNNHYTGKNIRESIPTHIKIAVWQRDKECCVTCFNNKNLEFDHIIPVSKGGANSIKNIQLLCRNCNRTKSNKII